MKKKVYLQLYSWILCHLHDILQYSAGQCDACDVLMLDCDALRSQNELFFRIKNYVLA